MSRSPRQRRRRPRPELSRATILATATRILAEDGLEQLSNARLAQHLGVTPAAIRWHVRSRDEILEGLVEAASVSAPPPPRAGSSWRRQLLDLLSWFRAELLVHRELVREPACWGLLLLAFPHVEFAARSILHDAGFDVVQQKYAARTLYRHALVFVSQELAMTDLAVPSRIAAFESALGDLPPEERAMITSDFARSDGAAPHELFAYGIGVFVDGLEDDLARPARRSSRGRA